MMRTIKAIRMKKEKSHAKISAMLLLCLPISLYFTSTPKHSNHKMRIAHDSSNAEEGFVSSSRNLGESEFCRYYTVKLRILCQVYNPLQKESNR